MKHSSYTFVCIELSRKASFTGGVEGGVGGWVRVVFANWADGAVSGGVMVAWGGGVVRDELSGGA